MPDSAARASSIERERSVERARMSASRCVVFVVTLLMIVLQVRFHKGTSVRYLRVTGVALLLA